jgi:hypothetical protein
LGVAPTGCPHKAGFNEPCSVRIAESIRNLPLGEAAKACYGLVSAERIKIDY